MKISSVYTHFCVCVSQVVHGSQDEITKKAAKTGKDRKGCCGSNDSQGPVRWFYSKKEPESHQHLTSHTRTHQGYNIDDIRHNSHIWMTHCECFSSDYT